MLGVLQLRQDLPAAGYGDQGLPGLCSHGGERDPATGYGHHHVDREVPERDPEAIQVPIRTTVEGSVDPYKGKPEADFANLKKVGFFTTTKPMPTIQK